MASRVALGTSLESDECLYDGHEMGDIELISFPRAVDKIEDWKDTAGR